VQGELLDQIGVGRTDSDLPRISSNARIDVFVLLRFALSTPTHDSFALDRRLWDSGPPELLIFALRGRLALLPFRFSI